MTHQINSRRRFLKITLAGALAGTAGRAALGADRVPLSQDDPVALALSYVADASTIDPAKNSLYKPGNNCANCMQFKDVDANGNGGCSLFPGKSVPSAAWCKAWIKK